MQEGDRRYEILDALPAYGPMYIPVTENGLPFYSEGFPVRFFKSDCTLWVANFQTGGTKLAAVFELTETPNLLVVAYGICYLMNPEATKPVAVFGVNYESAIETENNRIILQDETGLTIVEPNGNYWHSERISWDGLGDIKINESIVTGVAYDPMYDADEWVPFSYNIDTKELVGGSYPKPEAEKKSKWRFW